MGFKIIIHVLPLELRHTFQISYGSRSRIDAFVLELKDGFISGFGEATPIPYYGISIDSLSAAIERVRQLVENQKDIQPEQLWAELDPYLKTNRFAQCALDVAAWDFYGKKQGQALYKIWGEDLGQIPASNYTIGIDTVDVMIAKMLEFDFPIYKIKLGTENDIKIVESLRKHTTAVFRVDANAAWTLKQATENIKALAQLGVEFVEQPLAKDRWADMAILYEKSALPLMADESCQTEADVAKAVGHFHGVNIKLQKCGGLSPARRMISNAKALGLQVMCGCMTETSVGISAIGQLLPYLDYVDMDGAVLLKEDPATGVRVEHGRAVFPNINGTGAQLLREQKPLQQKTQVP